MKSRGENYCASPPAGVSSQNSRYPRRSAKASRRTVVCGIALENTWSTLDETENAAHDSLDTREIVRIQNDRSRLLQEAQQLQNGYAALQAERQRLEQHSDPSYADILNNNSPKSQLFLRVHRSKLKGDANALKRLMHADARCKAVGLKPDSSRYFEALDFSPDDRSLNDFSELSDEMREARDATTRTRQKQEPQLTSEQRAMARNLPGVTEEEYLAAVANPFSAAASSVEVEPATFDLASTSRSKSDLKKRLERRSRRITS